MGTQTNEAAAVVSLRGVTKTFGGKAAVKDISLDINRGEIFGFLGPNGAGKSTTIRLILDILRPDSGTISLLGLPSRKTALTHRHIGYLSGEMVFDTDLTGEQYIRFVSRLHGGGHDTEISRLADILEADLHVRIGNYSRGNRQKIGLIAALAHKPQLLILDEPTSGFDPLVQEKFAELVRGYVADGGTVFMSSHVLAEVQHLCDRVAFIRGGRIISTQSVAELLQSKAKSVQLSAAPDVIQKLKNSYKTVEGLVLVDAGDDRMAFSYGGDMRRLISYLDGKNLRDLTIREPELEEIFGQYYEDDTAAVSTNEDNHDA